MALPVEKAPRRDTIFAPSTAAGPSAVSVVRMSGPGCADALRIIAPGALLSDRVATLRRLRDANGELLDRALVVRFYAPRSFTGEEMAELHITGGRGVLRGVLETLGSITGLRAAEAGEFSWRAFENGKLDLSEIEGIGALVIAETAAQRRQALRVAEGQLSEAAETIRAMIVRAMSLLEAEIDFSDADEVRGSSKLAVQEMAGSALVYVRGILQSARVAERLRDGLTVVIAGPPNVGKSTLINALSKRDVSIVSEIPGTTRDLVEVALDLGGYPVRLIDTAGVRETIDPVERIGVERARKAAAQADLTLWLYEDDLPLAPGGGSGPIVRIRTKSDIGKTSVAFGDPSDIAISARSGSGVSELLDLLTAIAKTHFGETNTVSLVTERQNSAFLATEAALRRVMDTDTDQIELLAEDLRLAARAMGRISGRVDAEHVLSDIFARLCIGK